MKKIVTILAVLALLTLTSCGSKTKEPTDLNLDTWAVITEDNGNVEGEVTGTGSDEFLNDIDWFLDSIINEIVNETGSETETGSTNE